MRHISISWRFTMSVLFARRASIITLCAGILFGVAAAAAEISGAGATFPYPIYAKWARPIKRRPE